MLVRGGERCDSAWYAVIDDDRPPLTAWAGARLTRTAGGEGTLHRRLTWVT
jgi:hypothetical protein